MSKTNKFSFVGKYKVWTHCELIKLTESGVHSLDLDCVGFNVYM